jgi:hypothetical protein
MMGHGESMSTRERLIVAAVSVLAIALGGAYILISSQPPGAGDGAPDEAPAVNAPPAPEQPAGS